ncbi:hypothetical protein KSS87_013435 [Heliosperma pusillum]|nr:hypothetical protein KSS87_013435 [Heliosperma pusillum]
MTTKFMQSTIQASHLLPLLSKLKTQLPKLKTLSVRSNYTIIKHITSSNLTPKHYVRVTAVSEEHDSGVTESDNDIITLTKSSIYHSLEGINRGVFGVTSEKKKEIEKLVVKLEAHNPTTNPTQNLDKVSGCWKLIYSTITILGSKRTKLGLRDFINLGDFLQIIHVSERVNIKYDSSKITPNQV